MALIDATWMGMVLLAMVPSAQSSPAGQRTQSMDNWWPKNVSPPCEHQEDSGNGPENMESCLQNLKDSKLEFQDALSSLNRLQKDVAKMFSPCEGSTNRIEKFFQAQVTTTMTGEQKLLEFYPSLVHHVAYWKSFINYTAHIAGNIDIENYKDVDMYLDRAMCTMSCIANFNSAQLNEKLAARTEVSKPLHVSTSSERGSSQKFVCLIVKSLKSLLTSILSEL